VTSLFVDPHYASAESFVDRARYVAALDRYAATGCRVCTIYGVGGVGKSALAYQFSQTQAGRFEDTLWYTLTNAPPLQDLVSHLLSRFPDRPSRSAGSPLDYLIECLASQRSLIVLDNLEVLLDSERFPNQFRPTYEDYGPFLHKLASVPHDCMILITSREKPALLRDQEPRIRSMHIGGLARTPARTLLARRRLRGDIMSRAELISRYDGNPLAINLAADLITDLHGGDISLFLQDGDILFRDLENLLEEHFSRLSADERLILYRLAAARQPLSVREIVIGSNLRLTPPHAAALLQQLLRRSLVQERKGRFLLQYMVLEFVTVRLVSVLAEKVDASNLDVLDAFALVDATFPEYVRESQRRFVADPLFDRLGAQLGSYSRATSRLRSLLDICRADGPQYGSFVAANAVSLLAAQSPDMSGIDLSDVVLRQLDFSALQLAGVNARNAEFTRCRFPDTYHYVFALDFSPEGHIVAVGHGAGSVSLLTVPAGVRLKTLQWRGDYIRALAFSPGGNRLACTDDRGAIRVWDLLSGLSIDLTGHTRLVRAITFSPDGHSVFAGGMDPRLLSWSLGRRSIDGTDEPATVVGTHPGSIWGLHASPKGGLVAVAGDGECLALWSLETNGKLELESDPAAAGRWVRFTTSGEHVVVGCDDGLVRIWEASSGRIVARLTGHSGPVWGLAIAKGDLGDRLITGSRDGSIRIWDIAQPEVARCLRTIQPLDEAVWPVSYDVDGKTFAAVSGNSTIRFWDSENVDCLEMLSGSSKLTLSLAVNPRGDTIASGGHDRIVRLWDARTGRCVRELKGHSAGIRALAFDPSGKLLASASEDWDVHLWDVSKRDSAGRLSGSRNWLCAVAFDPSGRLVAAAGADLAIHIWDIHGGDLIQSMQGHSGMIRCLDFTPDGESLCSAGEDGQVRHWNLASSESQLIAQLDTHIRCLKVVDDGELIGGAQDGLLRRWRIADRVCLQKVDAHAGGVLAIARLAGERQVTTGGQDGSIRRWALPDLTAVGSLPPASGPVRSIALVPATGDVAYAGMDEAIRLRAPGDDASERALRVPRQFEGLNITGVSGLTGAQRQLLGMLGATEDNTVSEPQKSDPAASLTLSGPPQLAAPPTTAGQPDPGNAPLLLLSSATQALGPATMFISYSHRDGQLREQLDRHLAALLWRGVIEPWHDRCIQPGGEWRGEIDVNLESADIILLLVSAAFIASDYCRDIEMARAMERHREGSARVIPIILRECDWHGCPFGELQALPRDGVPVRSRRDVDSGLTEVAVGIRTAVESWQRRAEALGG
jgi:WD40 repeat protein